MNVGINYVVGLADAASAVLSQGQIANLTTGNVSVAAEINALNNAMESVPIDAETAKILAYVFTAVSIILLILFCALIKRILIAVQVIREATKAIMKMPTMTVFPFITYAWILIFLGYGLGILIFLGSAGSFNPITLSFADVHSSELCLLTNLTQSLGLGTLNFTITGSVMNVFIVYHIFGFIWTFELIKAISFLTISGAVATWYFSRTKDRKDLGFLPVFASYNRALRYYLGSAAFGSFLIAVIQLIRLLFNLMMRRLKKAKDHPAVKFMWVAVNCCLKCLKRFIDFLNKHAYIQVSHCIEINL